MRRYPYSDSALSARPSSAVAWFHGRLWLLLAVLVLSSLPSTAYAELALDEPIELTPELPSVSATIPGEPGGAFQEFQLTTLGGHRSVSVTLTVEGRSGSLGDTVGFNVYRISDGAWTTRGIPIGGDPSARTAIAALSSSRAASYSVQVFNYLPGAAVPFILTLDFAPLAGTEQSRGAPVLYAGSPLAAGRVDGLGAGSGDADSAYFLLAYPGKFQELEVTIALSSTAKELPRMISSSAGAFLWAGRKLIACAGPVKRLWSRPTGPVNGTLNLFGVPVPCSVPQSRYRAPSLSDPANLYAVSEARVLRWAGAANAQDLGLQIFNYKSSGPPGRVDYAVSVKGLRPAAEQLP